MFGGVLKNLLASGADDIARTATNQAAKKATTTISDDAMAAAKRYIDTGNGTGAAAKTTGKPYRIHDLSAIDEDRAAHLMRQGYTVAKDSSGKSLNLGDMKPIGGDLLDNLNPTGGVFVDYNPQARATIPLADNIKTLADTAKMNPDDLVDIYRGLPDNVEAAINPGDFVTTNPNLAASYGGNVHKMQARYGDILDDLNEPLGEEYIFRPQPTRLYHGTPHVFDEFDNAAGSTWFTGRIDDVMGSGLSWDEKSPLNIMQRDMPYGTKLATWEQMDNMTPGQLISDGYAGVKYDYGDGSPVSYEIFDPIKTLTRVKTKK